ncbi:MAG: glycogen synthase GlgA [Candidatus Hydrogenedentota bacterium]
MSKPLKILFVASEIVPLVKTGGLADVCNALPATLRELGHDVRVALPCYGLIPPEYRGQQEYMCVADVSGKRVYGALRTGVIPDTDIPVYLVEHNDYFDRPGLYGEDGNDYPDNLERFSFFNQALLHGVAQTGWMPDLLNCHDWHAALIPVYLQTLGRNDPQWSSVPCLFTIHNLAYQGAFNVWQLPETGLDSVVQAYELLLHRNNLNLLKGAVRCATRLNTVSPRYAQEIQTPEYGHGLERELRARGTDLWGILNGVDYSFWHPARDAFIPAHYSIDDLSGKAVCKRALQKQLGLPPREVPIFAMVTRMDWQKGLDLMDRALPTVLENDVQFVILGTGDSILEKAFLNRAREYPDKMRAMTEFDPELSHLIEAGADFFVMPSYFEPSGLSQLYSLAYGTVPIVRKTGGLADSVEPLAPNQAGDDIGTGIVFESPTVAALVQALDEAIQLYLSPDRLAAVRKAGMSRDFSWSRSAKKYVELYEETVSRP